MNQEPPMKLYKSPIKKQFLINSNDKIYNRKKNEIIRKSNSHSKDIKNYINSYLQTKSNDCLPKIPIRKYSYFNPERKAKLPNSRKSSDNYIPNKNLDYSSDYQNLGAKSCGVFKIDKARKYSFNSKQTTLSLAQKFYQSFNGKEKSNNNKLNINDNINEENEETKVEDIIEDAVKKNKKLMLGETFVRRSKKFNTHKERRISLDEERIKFEYLKYKAFPFSQAGTSENGMTKTNQDTYIILNNIFNLKFNIYGIMDGHGENGHLVSQYVRNQIEEIFTNPKTYNKNSSNNNFHFKEEDIFTKLIKNDFSLIKNIILKINQNLSHQSFDIDYSGTTLNLLIHINTHVISVNIGDSRSIILKRSFPKKTFEYLLLSIDHKPILKKEKERIKKSGGEVHKDIYDGKYEGPSRVWVKGENYPGIAISRSIGDYVAEKIGVISEPDIKSFYLDTTYKLAIVASDGLWDAFNEEDVISFSNQFFKKKNIENFSEEIGNESVKRWDDYSIERDDITVVTVLLNPF
jgi:serine/threonine protein phosphatase PrpC